MRRNINPTGFYEISFDLSPIKEANEKRIIKFGI